MAIACPHCGSTMVREFIEEGVSVDICPVHGVWLDRGELERIREAIRSSVPITGGPSAHSGGTGGVVKRAGERLADSALFGAGATVGSRIVDGILRAVLK